MLKIGEKYTRADIWNEYHPGEEFINGGNWRSGYVRQGDDLVIFMNIGVAGRTGHDFDNRVNEKTQSIQWYGKPKTHSGQETFKKLISGELKPKFFARWNDNKSPFTYLGEGYLIDYVDQAPIVKPDGTKSFAIKCFLTLYENSDDVFGTDRISQPLAPSKNTAERLKQVENTDGSAAGKTRKEQSILRDYLLELSKKPTCHLCGQEFPSSFLVAAHIKKRSLCSYQERINENVGMLACKFGCDDLYEEHYVFVDEEGVIRRDESKPITKAMESHIGRLDGKKCDIWSPANKAFFDAHRDPEKK
jgi:hypothetical protein